MNRLKRIAIAQDTLYILENKHYRNTKGKKVHFSDQQLFAENNTRLYSNETTDDLVKEALATPSKHNTTFTVNNLSTLDAGLSLLQEGFKDIMCLNFASAKNAGGGFLTGAQAQEESLARTSGLYNCLNKTPEYYETNRKMKSCFYTDYMIYSPNVPFFKDNNGVKLDAIKKLSIITAPAVNTGVVKKQEPHRVYEIENVMRQRINKVLAISKIHGHETLVLGAWGCGVFQNDPNDIARYFKDALLGDFKGHFKKIVFAIYSKNERFILPFRSEFE